MKKIKLELGVLAVESFAAQEVEPDPSGTVNGNQIYNTQYGCNSENCTKNTQAWTACTGYCCVATWMYPSPCTGYGQTCP